MAANGDGSASGPSAPDPAETDRLAEANRAVPRRGAPGGRAPTGWATTRRWFWVTLCVTASATMILLLALLRSG